MDLGFYCVSFLKFPEEDAAEGKKELISQGAIVFAENNTFTLLKIFLKISLNSGVQNISIVWLLKLRYLIFLLHSLSYLIWYHDES